MTARPSYGSGLSGTAGRWHPDESFPYETGCRGRCGRAIIRTSRLSSFACLSCETKADERAQVHLRHPETYRPAARWGTW